MDKLKIKEDKDSIYAELQKLAFSVGLAKKLYPRALHEVFLSNNLRVETPLSFNKKNYKKEEVRILTMAHLEVDLLKNEFATN